MTRHEKGQSNPRVPLLQGLHVAEAGASIFDVPGGDRSTKVVGLRERTQSAV